MTPYITTIFYILPHINLTTSNYNRTEPNTLSTATLITAWGNRELIIPRAELLTDDSSTLRFFMHAAYVRNFALSTIAQSWDLQTAAVAAVAAGAGDDLADSAIELLENFETWTSLRPTLLEMYTLIVNTPGKFQKAKVLAVNLSHQVFWDKIVNSARSLRPGSRDPDFVEAWEIYIEAIDMIEDKINQLPPLSSVYIEEEDPSKEEGWVLLRKVSDFVKSHLIRN